MKLYELLASNFSALFGDPEHPTNFPGRIIAQKPDCSAFLVLSETDSPHMTRVDAIPQGYDFTYRQAWGLEVTPGVIQRTVEHMLVANPGKWLKTEIDRVRDRNILKGVEWNGHKYHTDQMMIAVLTGRLTLWQEGVLNAADTMPVRRMDNVIVMLNRAEHAALADAIRRRVEAGYAESWAEKDALD